MFCFVLRVVWEDFLVLLIEAQITAVKQRFVLDVRLSYTLLFSRTTQHTADAGLSSHWEDCFQRESVMQ